MGGGVGHAISDLVVHDRRNRNDIVLLQKPEKTKYIDLCIENGIKVYIEASIDKIADKMRNVDIVILHWWHHPVMCRFLHDFPNIPVRLVLWSHISGCTYPMISYEYANKFSRIFFTSKYSLENSNWTNDEKREIIEKSDVIYGLGELSHMQPKLDYGLKSDNIKIGYTGTLTKSKICPEFPVICRKILNVIPNAEFFLLGDKESGAWMRDELLKLGIEDRVHFEGWVDNVNERLIDFDIFGYPLNPYHFGTTENSILEAMSVGLPIVLLNQATEKYIVTHNEDGILADGIEDYVDWVVELIKSEQMRKQLGRNAARSVWDKFSFKKNLERFQSEVNAIASLELSRVNFIDILGNESFDWFISAVSKEDRHILANGELNKIQPIFIEESKSSIIHFASVYPEDERLNLWR